MSASQHHVAQLLVSRVLPRVDVALLFAMFVSHVALGLRSVHVDAVGKRKEVHRRYTNSIALHWISYFVLITIPLCIFLAVRVFGNEMNGKRVD